MAKRCHMPGCKKKVRAAHLMCPQHWRHVPGPLRARLRASYHPGQDNNVRPTRAFEKAASEAIAAVESRGAL